VLEVSDEDAEKYADKVKEVSGDELEAELTVEPAPTDDEFDGMTRDQLIAYYNERVPDNPLPRSIRKPEAFRAVRSLTHG
jgi:hypothetical protein